MFFEAELFLIEIQAFEFQFLFTVNNLVHTVAVEFILKILQFKEL